MKTPPTRRSAAAAAAALSLLASLPLAAQADHLMPPEGGGGNGLAFDHRGGNEWWVEVFLSGNTVSSVQKVSARDDGGPWVPLEKKSWGNWAASFRIEPGHRMQFRAVWPDASGGEFQAWTSCWFTHPAGVEQCPGQQLPSAVKASTYVGPWPGGLERAFDVAVDLHGNAYVVGTRFKEYAESATKDAFVRKILPDGRTGWTTWLGGSHADDGNAIAVDGSGNVYVAGTTSSFDFPMNGWRTSRNGFTDAWAAKLDPSGRHAWSTYLGGSDGEFGADIGVGNEGVVVVAGTTFSCDYPTYGPAFQATVPCPSGQLHVNGFVTKLTADGRSAVYSTYFAGSGDDRITGVAVSPASGSAILTGKTTSMDFPVTLGAPQPILRGASDAFVAKLDPLAKLEFSTYLGGSLEDGAIDVARDASGNAYVAGTTMSTDFPTTLGAHDRSFGSGLKCSHVAGGPNPYWVEEECPDAFVAKVQADGLGLSYSTYLGTDRLEEARGIAVDGAGWAYVTGQTNATSFPGPLAKVGPGGGWRDAFAVVLSADGSRQLQSTLLGGTDGDFGEGVAVMAGGTAWYAGWTWSLDYPTTTLAAQRARDGFEDGFATRLAPVGEQAPAVSFDHKGGNEWWVEVRLTGAPTGKAEAMDGNSPWTALTLRDWGNWAGSFHIEPGNQVRFRALVDGAWQESCWFTHPAGKTPDGGETCKGGQPTPPPAFDATFSGVKGNEWWVQAEVSANEPIAGVDARVNCGANWVPLDKQSWGGWTKSFHVPSGSKVDFRAHSTSGASDRSGGYTWPQATPTAGC